MRSVAAQRLLPELPTPVHVLPICPRPYPQEAARSWLTRVGRVYALNPERLVGILGLVPFQAGSRRDIARPVESALEGRGLDQLAMATQLPVSRLAEMRPAPVQWTLTHSEVCSVCALCLDEDLCLGRDPYLRTEWRQAWRIFCSIHRVRLLQCKMSVVRGGACEPRVIQEIDDLYACSAIIEGNINDVLGLDVECYRMFQIIEDMECVIDRAIAGQSPNPFDWGSITAPEFLQIVHDVTSWSLTNFEAFKARPAAEDLPHPIKLAGGFYFAIPNRIQPPFDADQPVRTLSSVNNPAMRSPALWWAHVLLCETHRCHNRSRRGPPTRQWQLLHARCPTGLHWLVERMKHWPADYVRQHWTPLEFLLLPVK